MSGWMEEAKRRATLAAIAEWYAMRSGRDRRSFGPCPACQAETRGRTDRRPPLLLGRDGRSWRCLPCSASGSVIDLVALHEGLPPTDVGVRAWFVQQGYCEPPSPDPWTGPRYQRPSRVPTVIELDEEPKPPADRGQVAALWEACPPLRGNVGQQYGWRRWLLERGLDEDRVRTADLARRLSEGVLPAFASHWRWRFEVELVLPLFDHAGQLAGLQGRTLGGEPKSVCMRGVEVRGLVLASPAARGMLAGAPWPAGPDGQPLPLWVVEGEPDFLSVLARLPGAGRDPDPEAVVIGIRAGAWTEQIAARIPDGVRVLLATDQNKAGEQYAEIVGRTLQGRCHVLRLRWEPGPEPEHPRDINDHDREAIPFLFTAQPLAPPEGQAAEGDPADEGPYQGVFHCLEQWEGLLGIDIVRGHPPAQRWLLRGPPEWEGGHEIAGPGILPRGDVGLLSGAGAVGKSFALLQLAISVAMPLEAHQHSPDRFSWFGGLHEGHASPITGGWRVGEPGGRVAMVSAEESFEHFWRRFKRIVEFLSLVGATSAEVEGWLTQLRKNLVFVPGRSNHHLGWLDDDNEPTLGYRDLQRRLQADEYRLIILDPLARFSGADTEKDNKAATRLIQLAEELSDSPGKPNVLLSAHTSQAARQARITDATATRGVTGLGDGGRWSAVMVGLPTFPGAPTLLEVVPNKANHAPHTPPLLVVRHQGGVLSAATAEQREAYAKAKETAEATAKADKTRSAGPAPHGAETRGTAPSLASILDNRRTDE
jgi:hypothetical protein